MAMGSLNRHRERERGGGGGEGGTQIEFKMKNKARHTALQTSYSVNYCLSFHCCLLSKTWVFLAETNLS